MQQNFAVMFEDFRHERSLILILSPTDPEDKANLLIMKLT